MLKWPLRLTMLRSALRRFTMHTARTIALMAALAATAGWAAGTAGWAAASSGGERFPGAVAAAFAGLRATGQSARCTRASGHVLAAGPRAEVFTDHGKVYGCVLGSDRMFALGSSGLCTGASRVTIVAVAGTVAAFGRSRCGVDTVSTEVVVERLSDGMRLWRGAASTEPAPAEADQSVGSLAVAADGAVAWIGESGQVFAPGSQREVITAAGGHERVLDSGSSIAPRSLRLRGTTLSWRDGTRTRAARLA